MARAATTTRVRAGEPLERELLRATQAGSPDPPALRGRHLTLLVPFRDVEVDALLETESKTVADQYTLGAAAAVVRWRDGVIRELRQAGALILDVPPRELTPSLVNQVSRDRGEGVALIGG